MRRISIMIACLVGLACGSAKADWEYAKWGMTSEQIARASAGSVLVLPVAEERGGPVCLDSLAALISYSLVPITPPISYPPPSP